MKRKPDTSATAPRRRTANELHEFGRKKEYSPLMFKLYRRAEAQVRKERKNRGLNAGEPKTAVDAQRLLHELQVHQVELEMQNAELQEARDRMELLLEKYTDLYNFAPAGYFSLDEGGRVLEANLTGATLLGVDRSRLINQRLLRFLAPSSQPVFLAFLERVFAGTGKQVCEAELLKRGGTFWASLHGTSALVGSGQQKWGRLAVSDITSLKQAEEAQRRAEILEVANRELEREIARRQVVEKSLKQSKQQQGRLLQQSRQMQQQLRHLSHQILHAQEEERKRISRDLHDEITQILVGINIHLHTLARKARINPQGLNRDIVETQRLVEKSVTIVHQFARELRPTTLDDLGLIPTLHACLNDFMKRTGVKAHFTTYTSGRIDELNNAMRTVFYRVAQEALANIAHHANASRVDVSLRKLDGAIQMEVTDNGKSFQVNRVLHAGKNKRLGLIGMRERVEMVGGTFNITSSPGQGTTIRARIPFSKTRGLTESPETNC